MNVYCIAFHEALIDGLLKDFHGSHTHKTTMNKLKHMSFQMLANVSVGKVPEERLLGQRLYVILLHVAKLISTGLGPIFTPTSNAGVPASSQTHSYKVS